MTNEASLYKEAKQNEQGNLTGEEVEQALYVIPTDGGTALVRLVTQSR